MCGLLGFPSAFGLVRGLFFFYKGTFWCEFLDFYFWELKYSTDYGRSNTEANISNSTKQDPTLNKTNGERFGGNVLPPSKRKSWAYGT